MREKVLEKLQLAIQEQLTTGLSSKPEVPPLPTADDVLAHIGMDSFDIMEVVLKMENEFNINISDEEWAVLAEHSNSSTVNDFVDIIMSKF